MLHSEKTAAYLGVALGVAFTILLVTGLLSHNIQQPKSWFEWSGAPRDLYRVITATHVVTGFATLPLLLAKVWTIYPKLWARARVERPERRPLFQSPAHAVERVSLIALVGGSLFLVVGGIDDAMYIYVTPFTFTPTHYLVSWVTVGALVIHIGAKRTVTLQAMRRTVATDTAPVPEEAPAVVTTAEALTETAPAPEEAPAVVTTAEAAQAAEETDRRRFLITVGVAAGILGVNQLASNVSPLAPLALLSSRRADVGVQGLPVQTQAQAAGVVEVVTGAQYRLRVIGQVANPLELDLADILERVSHEVHLPISCVQGWSVGAHWRGVRFRDLLREAGVTDFNEVIVRSVQTSIKPERMFGRSRVNPAHALHPDTLLATELNGEQIHIDHGYPMRLIAPNNPGIMQTKWVEELWVR